MSSLIWPNAFAIVHMLTHIYVSQTEMHHFIRERISKTQFVTHINVRVQALEYLRIFEGSCLYDNIQKAKEF